MDSFCGFAKQATKTTTAKGSSNVSAAEASRKQLLGMKRKLTEFQHLQKSSSTKSSAASHQVEKNNPAHFVSSVFQKNGLDLKRASESSFLSYVKPTQEMIDSFQLETTTAVRRDDTEQLRKLLSEGTNLHCCNRFGESLVHMACRRGQTDMVRFLIDEAKAPLLVRDDFGRTPLHDACWTSKPRFDLVEYIVKQVPELLCVPDVRGHLPLNYARKEHWDDWFDFFNKHKVLLRPSSVC